MSRKNFTLLFLSSTGKRIRKLNLSRAKLIIFFITFVLLSFSFLYFLLDYVSLKHRSFENLMLRTENNNLNRQLDQFLSKMSKVEDTLSRVNIFASKLRMITKFEDPERLYRLAIGPVSKYDYGEVAQYGILARVSDNLPAQTEYEENSASLTHIDQKLQMLQHATALQEQNLAQLQELLEDQKSLLQSLPSVRPTNGWVTSPFGPRISPFTGLKVFHEGIDLATRSGTIIVAPADGLVTFSGFKPGYGNTLLIDHGYGIMTKYAHNSVHFVKPGDRVSRGQRIATVGNTGRSTGPHVHYEVIVNGLPKDPRNYILDE